MSKIIIQGTHLELTEEIKNYIYEKFNKLDRYFDNILEIRVEVERALPGHHNKGKLYRAEANVQVPKKILRVEKSEEDLFNAIDKTEKHVREMIKEYKEKMREK